MNPPNRRVGVGNDEWTHWIWISCETCRRHNLTVTIPAAAERLQWALDEHARLHEKCTTP